MTNSELIWHLIEIILQEKDKNNQSNANDQKED